jgi:hypothetical protein
MDHVVALFTLLYDNRDVAFQVASGIVVLASLVVAGTRTPDPKTFLGKAYKLVEYAALNFGKAKDTGAAKNTSVAE